MNLWVRSLESRGRPQSFLPSPLLEGLKNIPRFREPLFYEK